MIGAAGFGSDIFVDDPQIVVEINGRDAPPSGVVLAIIPAGKYRPAFGNLKRFDFGLGAREHREIRADDRVPIAVEPGAHQLRVADALEPRYIARIAGQADLVVAHP